MPAVRRVLMILLLLVFAPASAGAVGVRDSGSAYEDWEVVNLPVCASERAASEVYWAGVLYGAAVAEIFHLVPFQQRGECGWSDLFIPRLMRVLCQIGQSYECDAIEWWRGSGRVYLVIWPK